MDDREMFVVLALVILVIATVIMMLFNIHTALELATMSCMLGVCYIINWRRD